jgi:hypothetical protein
MDFTPSAEQQALRDSLKRHLARVCDFEARRVLLHAGEGGHLKLWRGLAGLGCLGAGVSDELGGFGGDISDMAMIAEELGRVLAPAPYGPHAMALAILSGLASPDPELIAELIAGERVVVPALLEPQARGDFGIVRATAVRRRDGFELSGAKALVEGAALASRLIVSARLEDTGAQALFLIEAEAPRLSRTPYRTIANTRVADFALDKVALPASALLTENAAALIERAADVGVVMSCAQSLGAMDAALWLTRDYLRTRKQFGQPLAAFQALQHRMADMLIETELARSMLFQALAALGTADPQARRRGLAAAKVQSAEAGLFVGGQAIQLHGAIGMTEEYVVGHYYKLLFANARLLGGADLHLERFIAASDQPAV